MLKQTKKKSEDAQMMIEYTIILVSVLAVMAAMSTLVKRTSQGWTKLLADQIGQQNEADQQFNDISQSHLDQSFTISRAQQGKTTIDVAGMLNYVFDDRTITNTSVVINLGVTPDPD